jgi:uncharacterized membrane protein YozB (DUF420 family)
MGLFNPNAPLISDVSLLFQIAVAALLVIGFLTSKIRRNFMSHGILMAAALIAHTIAISFIMVPSLLAISGLLQNWQNNLASILVIHIALGTIAEVLGIYFVGAWLLGKGSIKSCLGKKRLMRATIALWFASIGVGFYFYLVFYPI